MKRSLLIACTGLIAAGAAFAQTTPPAKSGPNNNAVNSPGQNNSNAPVAGRNSFTEGQAKSKIEEAGYTKVSDLKKDNMVCGAARQARAARPLPSAWILKATSTQSNEGT
jgi:hypothetical protein